MANIVKRVLSKGLIRRQLNTYVTPSDTAGIDNAIFPSEREEGVYEASNAVLVGVTGAVTVELLRTNLDGTAIYSPLGTVTAGQWVNVEAFRSVRATGTAATSIQCGVTSWLADPGVPGA